MRTTAVSSVAPFMRSLAAPSLRFASRAVKMTDFVTPQNQHFVCRADGAVIASSSLLPQCSVSLSQESDEGRVGCHITCRGTAGVLVSRRGKVVFQSVKSQSPTCTYAVELCEGDVVALHSHSFPDLCRHQRIFSEHHDAEYIAEELLLGMEKSSCVVGVVGRTEAVVQPPERNF